MNEKKTDNKEIERKWLIKKERIPFDLNELECKHIIQNYISFSPTKRIRNINEGEKYVMTLKSSGKEDSYTRDEYEFEISEAEYKKELKNTQGHTIDKNRYIKIIDDLKYEIDIFNGELEGLAYLEIEFKSEEEAKNFKQPEWIEKDVSCDKRYSNASLAENGKEIILHT